MSAGAPAAHGVGGGAGEEAHLRRCRPACSHVTRDFPRYGGDCIRGGFQGQLDSQSKPRFAEWQCVAAVNSWGSGEELGVSLTLFSPEQFRVVRGVGGEYAGRRSSWCFSGCPGTEQTLECDRKHTV